MWIRRLSISLLVVSWCACLCAAADSGGGWTLTRGDLSKQPVQWQGIDEQGVQVLLKNSAATIPWDQFVEIRRPVTQPPTTGPADFIVSFHNGDHLHGLPAGIEGEKLLWTAGAMGRIAIPLNRITGIRRSSVSALPPSSSPPTQDQAYLANGDQVGGIAINLTNVELTMQVEGRPATIPIDSLLRLRLAATGGAAPGLKHALQVTLNDGSHLTVSIAKTEASQLQVSLPDGSKASIPRDEVAAIEQINGPICRLPSLSPSQAVQVSQFGLSWPARMNRTVSDQPIRFGAQVYEHGIGVHAYSKLVFKLPEGYRTFRTRYAMDGDGRLADVTVRILVDGKLVYEKSDVRAARLSPVIELPIEGAALLTLEVDSGKNGDVQDHFNWIDPVLMRQATGSSTTVPAR